MNVAVMTVVNPGNGEHFIEEIVVVTSDGCAPFVYVGDVAFTFCFALLTKFLCGLMVFFLVAFLSLLEAVMARFQKHVIDFSCIDFDMDRAVSRNCWLAFKDEQTVLEFAKFVDLLIMQTVNVVFICRVHCN